MKQQTNGTIRRMLQRRLLFLRLGAFSAIGAVIAGVDSIANVTLVAIFGSLSIVFLSIFSYFSWQLLKNGFATTISRFQRTVRCIAGVLLLVIVLLVAIFGPHDYARLARLQYNGVETNALIADRYDAAYSSRLRYTFEANGKMYESTIIDEGYRGITLPVKYSPENPEVNLPAAKSIASALALEIEKLVLYILLLLRAVMFLGQARFGKVNSITSEPNTLSEARPPN